MEHRSEIGQFCFWSEFFANEWSQNVFFGPKTRQLSKTPRNFQKRAGTSQNTRGTSQKHPELSKNTRNFPTTPGTSPNVPGTFQNTVELPNTRGTSQKHPGRWWVVGGSWVGGFPQHPGKVLREWVGLPRGTLSRVNRWLVDVGVKPTWHATWQNLTCVITWFVHVAPTVTCQILLKNATSRHFWKKVPSLLRITIRTRIRICHKNIHPRSFQNFKFGTFSKIQNQNEC
jgi:hypothetical protein